MCNCCENEKPQNCLSSNIYISRRGLATEIPDVTDSGLPDTAAE